jgi:hypothetical protein
MSTVAPLLVAFQQDLNLPALQYAASILLTGLETPCQVVLYQAGQRLQASKLVLSYGWQVPTVEGVAHLHIAAGELFGARAYLRTVSLPGAPIWHDRLPVLFPSVGDSGGERATPSHRQEFIAPDILASAFFLLTGYEEVVQGGPLDHRGRYLAAASWLGRHKLLDRPLVNEYAVALQAWLRRLCPEIQFAQRQWHGRTFAVALTRDIDSLHKLDRLSLRTLLRDLLRGERRRVVQQLRLLLDVRWRGRRDPHSNLDAIINWERTVGIRSSFYLISSRADGDANYDLGEVTRAAAVRQAVADGWELGFHPGCRTPLCERSFLAEHAAFVRESGPALGGRQHGLRFRSPYTWRFWRRAGLRYDSTLGFVDQEGFRCGYCLPFRPFDLIENRVLDLWELPLTVMDCTLDRYRGLSPDQAGDVLSRLAKTVQQYRGVLVFLWHNTYFGRENVGPYHDVFAAFLEAALAAGAYVGPAAEVIRAWEATLPEDGGGFSSREDGFPPLGAPLQSVVS